MFFPIWIAVITILVAVGSAGCGPTRYLVDMDDCENVQDVQGMKVGRCAEVRVKK